MQSTKTTTKRNASVAGTASKQTKITQYTQKKQQIQQPSGGTKIVRQQAKSMTKQTQQKQFSELDYFCFKSKNMDYISKINSMGYSFTGEHQELAHQSATMPKLNQIQFETLGNLVMGHVQKLMTDVYQLQEIWLPIGLEGPKCNIFISEDFHTNKDKCLVLIQGTGAVRAGVWARSVCVNQNLHLGSMLPMIEFAHANKYSVIVLNPNMAVDPCTNSPISINRTMQTHCDYVWKHFISDCPAERIAIVAHSAGGRCVGGLYSAYRREFQRRVAALVFTDAYYHSMFDKMPNQEQQRMGEIGIHFKTYRQQHKDVGVMFNQQHGPIPEVSAGTEVHALSTGVSLDAILAFLLTKIQ